MKRAMVLILILLATTAMAGRPNDKVLWCPEKIDSGSGGWWFVRHITDKLDDYAASGMPGDMVQELVMNAVPGMKRATLALDERQYYWHWYGFRFSRSDAQGIYLAGPGCLKFTFATVDNDSFTLVDEGILIAADEQHNTYYDSQRGPTVIKRYKRDTRGVIKVWCLVRLPKRVGGQPVDRASVLVDVQPIDGRWEVIK
jgi:hypothetical protein